MECEETNLFENTSVLTSLGNLGNSRDDDEKCEELYLLVVVLPRVFCNLTLCESKRTSSFMCVYCVCFCVCVCIVVALRLQLATDESKPRCEIRKVLIEPIWSVNCVQYMVMVTIILTFPSKMYIRNMNMTYSPVAYSNELVWQLISSGVAVAAQARPSMVK